MDGNHEGHDDDDTTSIFLDEEQVQDAAESY
jgi:hypothetical protein